MVHACIRPPSGVKVSKNMTDFSHSLGAAANRRYAGQLGDFMKFDRQDCIWESPSAAVAELGRSRQ
jgi:hypothetical protein